MTFFIPIILVLGMVLIGFFVSKISIWKPKRTRWFATVYLGCGIIALVYLLFISSNVEKVTSETVLQQQLEENKQLKADLKNRRFDGFKEEHLKFTETFDVTEENIEILRNENAYYLPVVISWTDSTENKIVASYYETPLYFNRVDVSDIVKAPRFEWSENKLSIVHTETTVTAKSLRLSLDLLDSSNYESDNDSFNELIGERILHLNVPKQFNIIDNDGWHY